MKPGLIASGLSTLSAVIGFGSRSLTDMAIPLRNRLQASYQKESSERKLALHHNLVERRRRVG